MPPPLALLAALLPLAALAFTPGNLIVSLVGDGTVAGSAGGELSNQSLVVLTFEEFAFVNGSVLASTGQIRTVPSPEASQQGEPPFTTLGNAADPGGSNKSPQSGSLALSADGFYLTFVGYTCAAGTFVGTSNSGTGDVQTANTITHVSSSCTRLIAYIDATGLVRVVDGDLNSISVFTYPANNYYTQDVWSAVYCASCGGFYVTTGPIFNNGATGGIWFVPSPSIAGTLGAGIRLAATTQDISTGGKSNFGGYTTVGIFNGAFYVSANAKGVCVASLTLASALPGCLRARRSSLPPSSSAQRTRRRAPSRCLPSSATASTASPTRRWARTCRAPSSSQTTRRCAPFGKRTRTTASWRSRSAPSRAPLGKRSSAAGTPRALRSARTASLPAHTPRCRRAPPLSTRALWALRP